MFSLCFNFSRTAERKGQKAEFGLYISFLKRSEGWAVGWGVGGEKEPLHLYM